MRIRQTPRLFSSFFICILSWGNTDKEADDYKIICSMLWWGSNKCFAGASLLGIECQERTPGGRDISVETRKMTRVNQTVVDAVVNHPGTSIRTGTLIPLLAVVLPFDASQLRSSPRNHSLLKEATLLKVISISRGSLGQKPTFLSQFGHPQRAISVPELLIGSAEASVALLSKFSFFFCSILLVFLFTGIVSKSTIQ